MKQAGGILFFLTVLSFFASSQNLSTYKVYQNGDHHFNYQARVEPHRMYTVSPGQEFTGFALKVPLAGALSGASVTTGSDSIPLVEDPHASSGAAFTYSNLIVFDQPINTFQFYSGLISGEVIFVLVLNKNPGIDRVRLKKKEEAGPCDAPVAIDQSGWRAGLPDPGYNRSFTNVSNLIVHHSATSNSLTNYTNVVRNIYLFHTQERQWSDIGYNYLVAPDGTLYKGRDPAEGEQDNVLGAHFCGSNSQTMGACVLGTYTDVAPTEASLQTLVHLLAWKSGKSGLEPAGITSHPLNAQLPVIAGHRDGCATLCPGDRLYDRLPDIRIKTRDELNACRETEPAVAALFPNPAANEIRLVVENEEQTLQSVVFYDTFGHVIGHNVWDREDDEYVISGYQLRSGVYILHVEWSDGQTLNKKIVIMND